VQRAEVQQPHAKGYPHCPPGAVRNPELGDGETGTRPTAAEVEPLAPWLAPLLPGEFVSTSYEEDCARFVFEARMRARHRAEALLRPSSAFS
jgi:hypothetical protein